MILPLIFLALGALGFVAAAVSRDRDREDWAYTSLVILIPFLVVWLLVWTFNSVDVKRLRVFRDINKPNIERIIEETTGYLGRLNTTEWGLEKMQLYQAASERLVLLTEKANEYNKELAGYRYYKASPLFSWFVPRLDDLEYIEIKFKGGEEG